MDENNRKRKKEKPEAESKSEHWTGALWLVCLDVSILTKYIGSFSKRNVLNGKWSTYKAKRANDRWNEMKWKKKSYTTRNLAKFIEPTWKMDRCVWYKRWGKNIAWTSKFGQRRLNRQHSTSTYFVDRLVFTLTDVYFTIFHIHR